MNKVKQTTKYIVSDYLSALLSWALFFIFRKKYIDPQYEPIGKSIYHDPNFLWGVLLVPLFWVFIHYLSGYYRNIYRKSRLSELAITFSVTILGVLIIFFSILLDDIIGSYTQYYKSIAFLFTIYFICTYIPRLILTTRTNRKIHNKVIGFNTIIIGSNEKAVELYKRLISKPKSSGHKFIGFISINEKTDYLLSQYIDHLGGLDRLKQIIINYKIDDVIVAVEHNEHSELEKIINLLEGFNVVIKAIPDNSDILTGKVKISSLYDEPLIPISHELMPQWQTNMKRFMDVSVSLLVFIIFWPVYIFIALGVKMSSPGPIIYSHYRIGRHGVPFKIYKFRSMIQNAEANGPALSSENDNRITNFGKFMRKMRLDEIPQFYNVLIGDMSLVGPRPERKFFIDQIAERAPHHSHLLKVRPGITSWGQVKYGYAKDVDEMVERLKYDIIYIENMSIYIDIKILIYTIRTVIMAKGL